MEAHPLQKSLIRDVLASIVSLSTYGFGSLRHRSEARRLYAPLIARLQDPGFKDVARKSISYAHQNIMLAEALSMLLDGHELTIVERRSIFALVMFTAVYDSTFDTGSIDRIAKLCHLLDESVFAVDNSLSQTYGPQSDMGVLMEWVISTVNHFDRHVPYAAAAHLCQIASLLQDRRFPISRVNQLWTESRARSRANTLKERPYAIGSQLIPRPILDMISADMRDYPLHGPCNLCGAELAGIGDAKGAATALLIASLVTNQISDENWVYLCKLGALCQRLDDLLDIDLDRRDGITTAMHGCKSPAIHIRQQWSQLRAALLLRNRRNQTAKIMALMQVAMTYMNGKSTIMRLKVRAYGGRT